MRVRVVAATNKDLLKEVEAERFREDLYFRLNVIPIELPPLRHRREDIALMVTHFIREFCVENDFRVKGVDADVIARLEQYDWPGNVRELKNIIERVVIMSDDTITLRDLPPFLAAAQKPAVDIRRYVAHTLKDFKEEVEREFIRLRLEEHDWNISRTATALGIERTNLHKKLKAYNIQRGN